MMGKCLTLLLHKAIQERERDEAEEDDKENCTTDHSLGLWAVVQQQGFGKGEEKRAWSLTSADVTETHKSLPSSLAGWG